MITVSLFILSVSLQSRKNIRKRYAMKTLGAVPASWGVE
jgi:hypothetical protein